MLCFLCRQEVETVKPRRVPWDDEIDGEPICRECWTDIVICERKGN